MLFVHAYDLILKLVYAKGDGTYYEFIKELLSIDLLIIDEVGFKKILKYGVKIFVIFYFLCYII